MNSSQAGKPSGPATPLSDRWVVESALTRGVMTPGRRVSVTTACLQSLQSLKCVAASM